MEKLNKAERVLMVKAMEFIARQINDENIFEAWLIGGVADGDIGYRDHGYNDLDAENLAYYIDDENFRDLMGLFLRCMKRAYKSGGLYCDGIVSDSAT